MDPDKQDALNSIENSIYRTAFKLRSVQTLCQCKYRLSLKTRNHLILMCDVKFQEKTSTPPCARLLDLEVDLMDSSLIQHVLLRQSFWEARESPLSVQQLFKALQELFQRVRAENPGQVHPRASELTLSLLTAMYDSTGTGLLKLAPVAAALIALCGDSPLTKYRALFQLYAENNRGGYDSGARMTRRVLRNLLTDLQQIPTVVGESRALCSVESATRSCFQGVVSPTIKEEKFLSWLQSEPPILLWLPTCHRLSATEMVTHPVRCRICRNFPITGLRYRCLKCLDFDICQACFLSGLHSRSHQKAPPVFEHCVQQMSAKENTKFLLRTLRNNLLQGRCGRKEALRRRWLLDQVTPKNMADHAEARVLKKQLNRYKDKLQAIYAAQKEKSCRFETKIHQLTANQDSLWTQLQQMGQHLQAMLQPLHPSSSSCQNTISKGDHGKDGRFWRGGDSSQATNATEACSEWEPLAYPTMIDKSHQSQAKAERAVPNSESPEALLPLKSTQNSKAQSQAPKTSKEIFSSLPGSQEGSLQDTPHMAPEMSSHALATADRKEMPDIQEGKDELEEKELQELLSKLTDAFTLEVPPGPQSSVNMELYCGAERLCRAFSALVDQITLPNLK